MPPPALSDPWLASRKFGIVIDAGSSGSRLQIYSWKDARAVRVGATAASLHALPHVEKGTKDAEDWQYKAEPGISTFGTNPDGVAAYLAPLIAHAKDQIPPSLHRDTPIFLLATAGMRLLPDDQQSKVLAAACDYIFLHSKFGLDSGTKEDRCGRSIRIISGEEEGLFGWIAVNYLMNGFALRHKDHDKPTTYGFLDMGGASTQIAFEPTKEKDGSVAAASDNLADVRLRLLNGEEIHHQVFVTTWLGFGTNQARQRYVKSAVAEWEASHHHEVARSEVGYHHSKHATTTTSSIDLKDPCLPKNLVLHNTHHDSHADAFSQITPVTLTGTGSFSQCLARTTPLLNKTAPCVKDPCLFNGAHVPPIDFRHHRFIGISEYWYSSQHVFGLGGAFDFEKYEKAAEEFCGRDWEDILEQHRKGATPDASTTWGKEVDKSRLEMQCFKAAWIVNILGQGMGIPRTSKGWKEMHVPSNDLKVDEKKAEELGLDEGLVPNPIFQSIDTIRGTAISWTLGKMVLEASKGIPSASKSAKPLSDPMGPDVVISKPSAKLPFGLDAVEGKLPTSLRRESLGFSPIVLFFYILVLLVLAGFASRLRHRISKSFRKWRRGAMKREKDSFVNEDLISRTARSSDSDSSPSRPESPVGMSGPASHSFLSRFFGRANAASPSPRKGPNGGLTITPSRPLPRYSYSMPSPISPSWTNVTLAQANGGTPLKYSMEDTLEPPPPNSDKLNPNSLTLALSRNSSQINLARTLPTPRNVSGFSTPGPGSGFRTPTMYDDDA